MKVLSLVGFLVIVSQFGFSQDNSTEYDYANGNGTILSQSTENGNMILIRKHEDRFDVWPNTMGLETEEYIVAYEEPNVNSHDLFHVENNEDVNTTQVAYIKSTITNESSSWVKIRTDDNKIGWLNMGLSRGWDYYSNGQYSRLLKTIHGNGQLGS